MGKIFRRTYKAKDGTVKTCATWTLRYYRNGRPIQEFTKFGKNQKGKAQCRFSEPRDPFLKTFSKPFPPLD